MKFYLRLGFYYWDNKILYPNISEAKKNGFHLLCGGRFTWQLEREWDSIISIVPEEYAEARALNNIDMEAVVDEAMIEEAQAQADGMQECYDL